MQGEIASTSVDDKRGFIPQDPEITRRLKALAACDPVAPVGACLLDWGIILAAAAASWAMFSAAGITVVSVAVYGMAAFVIASRQQGLQNLIHEASHYNLSRRRRVRRGGRPLLGVRGYRAQCGQPPLSTVPW